MNRLMNGLLFIALLLGLSVPVRADNDLVWEMPLWKDPATHTTTKLYSQCGLNVELRVFSTPRAPFLNVTVKNISKDPLFFKPSEVSLRFDNDELRKAIANGQLIEVNRGQIVSLAIQFLDKKDFSNRKWLQVEFPVHSVSGETMCSFTGRMNSYPGSEAAKVVDVENLPAHVVAIGLGPSLTMSGPLKDLGTPLFGVSGEFDYYLTAHHGAFARFGFQAYPSPSASQAGAMGFTSGATSSFIGMQLMVGYAYRRFISEDFALGYGIGPGLNVFSVREKENSSSSKDDASFAAFQELSVDWRMAHYDRERGVREILLGVTLMHLWVPQAKAGALSADGQQLSPMLTMKFGM